MICLRDVSLLAAAALIGCSPVVDPSNSPDAQIDAPDTTAPGIASANVKDMGTRFSVLDPIVISFDEELDPATVSATSVTLSYDALGFYRLYETGDFGAQHGPIAQPATRVRGTVTYDAATRKLTFTPAVPLAYGYVHTLRLTDLKDVNGNAFSTTITFRTYINAVTRRAFFSTSSGATSSYYRYPTDTNGFSDKRVYMSNFGPDSMWFTMDDNPGEHINYTYDARGRLLDETYMNRGPDNRYDTADDVPIERFVNVVDAAGKHVERGFFTGPGTDGQWGTPDDVLTYLLPQSYMGDRHSGFTFYTSPGTDAMWRTPDDRCALYWDYEYDAQGNKTRETRKTCNGDQLPRTADDTIDTIWDYTYDANGNLTSTSYRYGAGTDAMWGTPDDLYSHIDRTQYDASGLAVATLQYTGPGTDNLWNTEDDVATYLTKRTYDMATKLPIDITAYGEDGADNMWNTADDVINTYQTITYDGQGNRLDIRSFQVGPDGMWRTADDRVFQDEDFDTLN